MSSPLDQSIVELLRGSSLAPMIDRPVNDILKDMGLPQLPDLSAVPPMPGMPPMPVIDLSALMRPFTDLASSFGTGVLGSTSGPGIDPTQALSGVTQALQTAMQMGTSALQMAMQLWQGMAAAQAAEKAGQAAADGADLATQGMQEKAVLGNAAGSVAVGGALLGAVIAKYMATMIAASPLLASPGGQWFLVAQTAESLAEATAVVAKTRVEMTGHSASMTAVGQKKKITAAPTGVNSMEGIQQLMQLVQPLMGMVQTGTQSVSQLAPLLAPKVDPVTDAKAKEDRAREALAGGDPGKGVGAGGPGGSIGSIGGGPGVAPAPTPLAPWAGTKAAGVGPMPGLGGVGTGGPATEATAMRSTVSPGAATPGMMPLAGAAGAAAGARADDVSSVSSHLVTGQHGDEVVGNIEGVSLPVVGATEQVSEPPPDKELTL
ncbi:hypothetical protein [Nocardia iowensis]|uniref:Uncharacterized protein n=1 Tax=Nocardia iowensis TaxID=204891 RepID=A0ABX8RTA2_NOCIO|nr:hypothetical protein [Nocardia iowensis]QXN92501.1 hypothetical protein KV110_04950 [Nocardia iowensis]